jgi:hypothetical protein
MARSIGVLLGHAGHPGRRERQVLQHRQVRKQVELLEHHADLAAHRVDRLDVVAQQRPVDHVSLPSW